MGVKGSLQGNVLENVCVLRPSGPRPAHARSHRRFSHQGRLAPAEPQTGRHTLKCKNTVQPYPIPNLSHAGSPVFYIEHSRGTLRGVFIVDCSTAHFFDAGSTCTDASEQHLV